MRAIEEYLRFISHTENGTAFGDPTGSGTPVLNARVPLIDRAVDIGRAARIYQIDSSIVSDAFHQADEVAMDTFGLGSADRWAAEWRATAAAMPFPVLPFPVAWVGFSEPIPSGMLYKIEQTARFTQWGQRVGSFPSNFRVDPDDIESRIVGMLLAETDDGRGMAIWLHRDTIGGLDFLAVTPVCDPDIGWVYPLSARWGPTVIVAQLLNEAPEIERPVSAAVRRVWSRSFVHGKLPPRPWFEISAASVPAAFAKRAASGVMQELERVRRTLMDAAR